MCSKNSEASFQTYGFILSIVPLRRSGVLTPKRAVRRRREIRFGAGPASAEAHAPSVGSSYVHCSRLLSSAEVI